MDIPTVTCDVCGTNSGLPYEQYWAFSLSGGKCTNCNKKMINKKNQPAITQMEQGQKPVGLNDVGDGFL